LHLAGGVGVVGAPCGGETFLQAGDGFFGAVVLCKGLGGHLVGGDVVGVVVDEGREFGESEFAVALSVVLHSEAVAGEGVGGVGGEDFGEGCDLVHELMVRCGEVGWQVGGRLSADLRRRRGFRNDCLEAGPPLREDDKFSAEVVRDLDL